MSRRRGAGWSRRQVLASGMGLSGALAMGLPRAARAGSSDQNLVIWWNGGGWDPTFVFDPHFGADIEGDALSTEANVGGIRFADADSRPSVRSYFERWASRSCVVNGISVGSISHDGCSRLVLTGLRAEGSDVATLVATRALDRRALPFVSLGGPRYPGKHGEVLTPVGPVLAGVVGDSEPAEADLDPAREELLLQFMEEEAQHRGAGDDARPRLSTWAQAVGRLRELRGSSELLEMSEEPSDEELVAVGVELLGAGLCSVLGLRAPLPDLVHWDSHNDNQAHQEQAYESSFAHLDALLSALDAHVDEQGSLLDRTTVLVLSEMGRTPRLNPGLGKDHWPYTSAMIVGAGVGGGRVVGASDSSLVAETIDLASGEATASGSVLFPQNLVAGVLQAFDIDPEEHLPGVVPFTAWRG